MLELFFQAVQDGIADLVGAPDLVIGALLEALGFMAVLVGLIFGAWCIALLIRGAVRYFSCLQRSKGGHRE